MSGFNVKTVCENKNKSDIVPALSLDLYSESVVLRNTFCFNRKGSLIKYDLIKWTIISITLV
jgi:hypothetical protein